MAGRQLQHDLHALADLGLILKALVELLDHGQINEERFVREAREAAARFDTILGDSGDVESG